MNGKDSEDLETVISDIIDHTPTELLVKDDNEFPNHPITDLNTYTLKQACEKIIEFHKIEHN